MKRFVKLPPKRPESLTDRVYHQVKEDIFRFCLLPGEHFTENEISTRTSASRTPVREALYRLRHEGLVQVHYRSGWQVNPLDFDAFDQLYDLRITLELASVRKLCTLPEVPALEELKRIWLAPPAPPLGDGDEVSLLDERFHGQLVEATGNREMARVHSEITERIRIIRRLDFTKADRVAATYDEHRRILEKLIGKRGKEASRLLAAHIEASKAAVRQITLHMLHEARERQRAQ